MIHAKQLAQHVHKSSSSRLGLAVGPGHLGLGCLVNQFNHIRLRGQRLASGIVNFQQVHGVIHGMAAFFSSSTTSSLVSPRIRSEVSAWSSSCCTASLDAVSLCLAEYSGAGAGAAAQGRESARIMAGKLAVFMGQVG